MHAPLKDHRSSAESMHSAPDSMAPYVECPRVARIAIALALTVCIGQLLLTIFLARSESLILQWVYTLALWGATIAAAGGYGQSRIALLSMGLVPFLSIIDGIRAGSAYVGSYAWIDIAIDGARFIPLCVAGTLLFAHQSTRWFSWHDESRKVGYKRRT
jgi:hypothetical protein